MTPAERAFWQRANRRAATQQPEIQQAMLRAFQIIRESLSDAELERIVASGAIDQLFVRVLTEAVLDRAFIPLRQRIRQATERQVKFAAADLPGRGKVNGQISVSFDVLNPKVIEAVRALDTKVVQTLKSDVVDVVRAHVENGLRDGVNPRVVARELGQVIGLAPNQEAAVRNFRKLLEDGDPDALVRKLRDRRFDSTVRRGALGPEQIEKMTDAYRRRMIAFNAETNARTASLDSMRAGQRLSWQSAIDSGIVDGSRLVKRWSGVLDARERPEHVAMEGETVPFDQPFSNGEMTPGESTYNCRCIALMREQRR
jgi:hypothetical protein